MSTEEVLQQHLDALLEHFDSVQIFATRMDGVDTESFVNGGGDWFARYGRVSLWLEMVKREQKREAIDE